MKKGLQDTACPTPLMVGTVHHPEAPAFQELGESPGVFLLLPVSSTLAASIWGVHTIHEDDLPYS